MILSTPSFKPADALISVDNIKRTYKNIILDGDSRTDGWNCEYRYPYIDLLNIKTSYVQKVSDGGNTTNSLLMRLNDSILPKYNKSQINIVVVWIGVNDIAVQDKSSQYTYDNIKEYCLRLKENKWNVYVCTEVSMKGVGSNGECDSIRLKLNNLIYDNYRDFSDGIIDLATLDVGKYNSYKDTTLFCDGIHLTNKGTQQIADMINKHLN